MGPPITSEVNGFTLTEGSGTVTGTALSADGFSGFITIQGITSATVGSATTMTGSIQASGSTISANGNYAVEESSSYPGNPWTGTFNGTGPATLPTLTTALVQGTLTPDGTGQMGATLVSDFSGDFSFSVDLATGVISNGAMNGSSASFSSGSGGSYTLSDGSGSMSAGTFFINDFQGTVASGVSSYPVDSDTYMNGTGHADSVGSAVSGTYLIDSSNSLGWNIDGGTFIGIRTQ
jgi:hypothetical protein